MLLLAKQISDSVNVLRYAIVNFRKVYMAKLNLLLTYGLISPYHDLKTDLHLTT